MATYKEMKTLKFPDSDVIYVVTDEGKIEKDQGIENAGKVLGVGDDGSVTLIDAKNLETEIPAEILLYTEQTLTDEQKTQARINIGAGTGSSDFSGNYNDLDNLPELFSGSYNDLTDKPVISSVDVDAELSNDSTNPVQNKVIYAALENKSDSTHTHDGMATITYVDSSIMELDPDGTVKSIGGIVKYVEENSSTGDMKISDYDPDNVIKDAGGIAAYVSENAPSIDVVDSVTSISTTSAASASSVKKAYDKAVSAQNSIPTLSSSVSSTSTTTAANSYAVKQAYDKGASALSVANAAIPSAQKGAASGVAPLNASKKIDSGYLPFETGELTVTNPGYTCTSFTGKGHYIKLGDLVMIEISVFMKFVEESGSVWDFNISGYDGNGLSGVGFIDNKIGQVQVSSYDGKVYFSTAEDGYYQSFKCSLIGVPGYL